MMDSKNFILFTNLGLSTLFNFIHLYIIREMYQDQDFIDLIELRRLSQIIIVAVLFGLLPTNQKVILTNNTIDSGITKTWWINFIITLFIIIALNDQKTTVSYIYSFGIIINSIIISFLRGIKCVLRASFVNNVFGATMLICLVLFHKTQNLFLVVVIAVFLQLIFQILINYKMLYNLLTVFNKKQRVKSKLSDNYLNGALRVLGDLCLGAILFLSVKNDFQDTNKILQIGLSMNIIALFAAISNFFSFKYFGILHSRKESHTVFFKNSCYVSIALGIIIVLAYGTLESIYNIQVSEPWLKILTIMNGILYFTLLNVRTFLDAAISTKIFPVLCFIAILTYTITKFITGLDNFYCMCPSLVVPLLLTMFYVVVRKVKF